jgi:cellulose synthase/poly-beta-1,6-N-acetylglucosamine synthase-like glycosyltransferase
MGEDQINRLIIVITLLSLIFLIPILLVMFFLNFIFLIVLVSPASSIVYLLITSSNNNNNSNNNHNNNNKVLKKNYKRSTIGFPFIIVGFVIIPFLASIVIISELSISLFSVVILLGLVWIFITSTFYLPLSVYQKYFSKNKNSSVFQPPVTIIVPAYNEETSLGRTLDSIVEVDYPNKEVIVVDDGSTDKTHMVASSYKNKFHNNSRSYSVIHKENGGKSSAINYAIRFSKNDIVIVIDADSIMSRNAIKSIVKHFDDINVVAVAGYIRVLNPNNLLTNCTALEVVTAFNSIGRAYGLLGAVMIIPGALGAFRKQIMIERGLYDEDTMTEDFDLTVKLLKTRGKVRFEDDSLSYTEVPNNLKDLYKQRKRWYTGNFQTLIRHTNILTNNGYGFLHTFGYPMTLLLFVRPLWSILIHIAIVLSLLEGRYMLFIVSYFMFLALQFLISTLSIIMDGRMERLKLILYSPLMAIGYQQILDFILVKSILDVLFHRNMKWTRMKRLNHN